MSQSRFDMCRICLIEPQSEYLPFTHIMTPIDGELKSKNQIMNLLGIDIEPNDVKPKVICRLCSIALDNFEKMREKASESQIVLDYMTTNQVFGVSETSIESASSLLIRDNEESSQESHLPSIRLVNFGSPVPGTSTASTSSMIRGNEESSQKSHLPSIRLVNFGSPVPGTSTASTSSMIRDNEESSQKSRLPSERRLVNIDSCMPGTSTASTSSLIRDNEESSQKSHLPSIRLVNFGSPVPGTSTASTSSLIRDNEESSQKSRSPTRRLVNFGFSMPGTSTASTSSSMFRNDEESSWESPYELSRFPPKRLVNFGSCMPGTSTASTSSLILRIDESDDDSDDDCIVVSTPVETIEIISDDEDGEYDYNNIENERRNVETIEISDTEEIVDSSSDSDNNGNLKNKYFNNVIEKLYYCSICKKKNILNHNCSVQTKNFYTCLVPCCNILSRSKKDFTFHYQMHIGISSSEVMCNRCYKGIDRSNIDGNGCHIHCSTANSFRCYSCNVRFNGMQEFAFHKLKTHNGILMDAECNYLCLYCEESSPDILEMTEHIKHCLKNQQKNVTAASMKLKKPTKNGTELLPVKIDNKKNVMVCTNGNAKKIPCTSQHVLFTCLKPSCNKIFASFCNFKHHYRRHFQLGSALVCWQCCKPFSDAPDLRAHQVRDNCRTPGIYKCFKCSSNFDDIESLSIHKLTFHDGILMASKRNRKTIKCAFCKMNINIFDFKSHLVTCKKKNNKNNTYTCLICKKVFRSRVSLSNHSRIHYPSRINSNVKKE